MFERGIPPAFTILVSLPEIPDMMPLASSSTWTLDTQKQKSIEQGFLSL